MVVPVASTAHLIALKVLARDDENRPQDRQDLQSLIRVATSTELDEAADALRLISERGFHRDRKLLELFEEARSRFAVPTRRA